MVVDITIFASIPDDLPEERNRLVKVVDDLSNDDYLRRHETSFLIVSWDFKLDSRHLPVAYRKYPHEWQENEPRPATCDVFVMALWTKLERPLQDDDHNVGTQIRTVKYGTEWDFEDAWDAKQRGARNTICVYNCKQPLIPTENLEADEDLLTSKLQVSAFLRTFKDPKNEVLRQDYYGYNSLEDFETRLKDDLLNAATQKIEEQATGKTRISPARKSEEKRVNVNPFPGLFAFKYEMHDYFFGRTGEINGLLEVFSRRSRHLLVTGASGSGKSSLVWAGLLPNLREWQYIRFTPGKIPLESLAAACLEKPSVQHQYYLSNEKDDRDDSIGELVARFRANPQFLIEIADVILTEYSPNTRLLLFIDQLEELFTAASKTQDSKTPDQLRYEFLRVIVQTKADERLGIVATLRSDLYDEITGLQFEENIFRESGIKTLGNLFDDIKPLGAPTRSQLYQMIVKPMEIAQIGYDDMLPYEILQDSGGSIPLTAYTLEQLYKRCQSERYFHIEDYIDLGRVNGIIGGRVNEELSKLARKYGGDQNLKEALMRLFPNLVTITEEFHYASQPATPNLFKQDDTLNALIDGLSKARLLYVDKDSIRLAHEELIEKWDDLKKWTDEHQNDYRLLHEIKYAARVWHEARGNADSDEKKREVDRHYLWFHERLIPVYEMLDRLLRSQLQLDPMIREFIRPEIIRLQDQLGNPYTIHRQRLEIGERMAIIAQQAMPFGKGFRCGSESESEFEQEIKPAGIGCIPAGQPGEGLPDIYWSGKIPGSETTIKDKRGQLVTVTWEPFYMARFPVTYEQYKAFADPIAAPDASQKNDGYDNDEWWDYPEERPNQSIEQVREINNHPADMVSWHDAVAFGRWLTSKYQQVGLLSEDYEIRLPYEWEWQYAMTGGQPGYKYPWGKELNTQQCNTLESKLRRTVAVGMYPDNYSRPFGIWDMFGNIAEWCYNVPNETTARTKINPCDDVKMVVCGGSFGRSATIDHRYTEISSLRRDNIGFRVICARKS